MRSEPDLNNRKPVPKDCLQQGDDAADEEDCRDDVGQVTIISAHGLQGSCHTASEPCILTFSRH